MSDRLEHGAKAGARRGNWLAGRAGRKEYWLWIGIALGLGFLLNVLDIGSANSGVAGVMMVVQIRRLHDFGRTGWWAVGLLVAQLVAAIGLMAVSLDVGVIVAAVIMLAATAWIGAVKGDPLPNRFGPAPGKPSLKETFD